MTYEVELKFPLREPAAILSKLEQLQAVCGSPCEQRDLYYAHPVRDFAETDEALRIRRDGERNIVTYKGPLVDLQTKTRREIEVPLADGAAAFEQFGEILTILGFRPVRTVAKKRTPYRLVWEEQELETMLDEVEGLGTFLEIELVVDESRCDAARDSILRLADRLGLENSERRSYLCLLLEREGR